MSSATQPSQPDSSASADAVVKAPDVQEGASAQDALAEELGDEGEDGDDDEEERPTVDAPGQSSGLNAKQRKKKKSKAAARLRKRLGMGGKGGEEKEEAGEGSGSLKAAEGEKSGGKGKTFLSDSEVHQLQQAIEREQGPQAAARADKATLEKLIKMMNLERTTMLKDQDAKQSQYKSLVEHKFWKTQPVPNPDDKPLLADEEEGPMQPNVPREQVRQEPIPLKGKFSVYDWSPIDIDDAGQLKEVYDLLSANYVEDVDSSLRFDYSPEFLNWVLKHPGYYKTWHIGLRAKATGALVAFISAIPHELRARQQAYPSAEVNFLCVHKDLRDMGFAPTLIREVTRQCHLVGTFQAIYTGGNVLPTAFACARYYHRTLNAEKLLEIGFSGLRRGQSKEAYVSQYSLPAATRVQGLREIEERDVPAVGRLMRRYLRRYDVAARFSDDEVRHLLLSGKAGAGRKQVTWTYVVEDAMTSSITDMMSFYSLPSSILDSKKHKTLEAAYLFYYATEAAFTDAGETSEVSTSTTTPVVSSRDNLQHTHLTQTEQMDEENVLHWSHESKPTKEKLKKRLNALVFDMLVLAKQQGFDVLNCLTVMDNPLFVNEQLFGPGDGFLRHYLFNWRIRPIAGGMGGRPGESELDPVAQNAKKLLDAEPDSGKLSQAERVRRLTAAQVRPEVGSGVGIVMV